MKGLENIERTIRIMALGTLAVACVSSCCNEYLVPEDYGQTTCNFNFKVSVAGQKHTKSQYVITDQSVSLDDQTAFGLVGIGENSTLVIDNEEVFEYDGSRRASIPIRPDGCTTLNAYYPHTASIDYHGENRSYIIMYTADDIVKGAKVSNSVAAENSCEQISNVDLEFHNITNEIGFRIADMTQSPQLAGHIHLREITAYGIASEGTYAVSADCGEGSWSNQNDRRSFNVFEGDSRIPDGRPDGLYITADTLSALESDCHTFYEIPETVRPGLQYIRVVFDVEPFDYSDSTSFPGMKGLTQVMMLDGVLPDNEFVEGRKYIFTIGPDLERMLKKVEFSAQVGKWENTVSSTDRNSVSFSYEN